MKDKIEFSVEDGKICISLNVVDIKSFIGLVSYLLKSPIVLDDIKSKLAGSEQSGLASILSLLSINHPVIKPSEFK